MQHAAPLLHPQESIYSVLAAQARRLSDAELGVVAIASGLVAVATVAAGRTSWTILGLSYAVWCFAGWGIVFGPRKSNAGLWRALELLIAGSATVVCAVVGTGIFFWALGSHWQL